MLAIREACNADRQYNLEREVLSIGSMQYLYEKYGDGDEVDEHREKLRKIADHDSLTIEGRLFVLNEIWDIKIAALADATD